MSRLLKEDAAVIGEAYEKILSEALYGGGQEEGKIPGYPKGAQAMPHQVRPGSDPSKLEVSASQFKRVTHQTTGEISYKFLSYLDNPDWETKKHIMKGFHSLFNDDQRARIITRFAKELIAHITEEFKKHPGSIHPGKKLGGSTVGMYELSHELVPWIRNWKFPIKTSTGLQDVSLILTDHLSKYTADQVIKQVLEKQGQMDYIPAEGEKGFRGGSPELEGGEAGNVELGF